jgi:hypothetical protein
MKKFSLLFSLAFLLLLGACTTPSDYNTAIMKEILKVERNAADIGRLLGEQDFKAAQTAFLEGKNQTEISLRRLERMSAFRDDDSLRQAAINFVAFYDKLFTDEYEKAFDLLQRGAPFSAEEADFLSEIKDNISEQGVEVKLQLVDENFAFVRRYGLFLSREP